MVLLGGGALLEFWISAAQHLPRLALGPPVPVGFFGSAESLGTGSGASSRVGGAAAGVEAAGGAEGNGGGGSSFLQPYDEMTSGSTNPDAMIATTERSGFMGIVSSLDVSKAKAGALLIGFWGSVALNFGAPAPKSTYPSLELR